MRGFPSSVTGIRKKVFTEVARLAYDGDYDRMEDLPYVIVPGEEAKYRESIFLERAIAGERVRVAMGLPLRPVDQRTLVSEGLSESAIAEKYYEPPLINIINYACHACPTRQYRITEYCQGCLARVVLPPGLPQGRHPLCQRQVLHPPGFLHQVRQVRRRVQL